MTRDWKKLHDEELTESYSSSNIGNMRLAGNVECMATEEGHTGYRRGTMKGKDPSKNRGGEERIILKSTLKKYDGRTWTALLWLRVKKSGGFCEDGNEPSGCTICKKFLDRGTICYEERIYSMELDKGEWLVSCSEVLF